MGKCAYKVTRVFQIKKTGNCEATAAPRRKARNHSLKCDKDNTASRAWSVRTKANMIRCAARKSDCIQKPQDVKWKGVSAAWGNCCEMRLAQLIWIYPILPYRVPNRMRVIVCNDQAIIRDGLEMFLNLERDIEMVWVVKVICNLRYASYVT